MRISAEYFIDSIGTVTSDTIMLGEKNIYTSFEVFSLLCLLCVRKKFLRYRTSRFVSQTYREMVSVFPL